MKTKKKAILLIIFILCVIILSIYFLFTFIINYKDNDKEISSVDYYYFSPYHQNKSASKYVDEQDGWIDTQFIDLSRFINKEYSTIYEDMKANYPLIVFTNDYQLFYRDYYECLKHGQFWFVYYIDSSHLLSMYVILPELILEEALKSKKKIDLDFLLKQDIYKIYQTLIDINKYKSFRKKLWNNDTDEGGGKNHLIRLADSVTNYRKKHQYYMLIPNK